jgi:Na+/H+ antiporter NhaD/arsenite permease-like protein
MSVSAHGGEITPPTGGIFDWQPLVSLGEYIGLSPAIIVSTTVLVIAYAFIISEKLNRAVVALIGAGLMIFLGVMNQHTAVQGIDFNTIFLLIGMMAIVGITKKSGVFQYVAILTAKRVKGNPRSLLFGLAIITAVFSALLDNVTTVMLIVPVTLLLTDQLKLNPYPFLFSQIFASNIGGMATLIGDPPNILIGSAVGFSFMDFVYNTAPAALIIMIFILVFFDLLWGRKFDVPLRLRARLMSFEPRDALTDVVLLWKSLFVMALVIFGFVYGHGHGIEPGTVALVGAAFLMLLEVYKFSPEEQSHKVHKALSEVEWETIFFFMGLFMLVYGVEQAGLLSMLGQKLLTFTEGDIAFTAILVLWSSAILSAIVDNIPFVATMIPLIQSMEESLGGHDAILPIWWALSLGACLGGNGSLVGASANVMVASFAERAGHRISFLKFMKLGFPLMLATIVIAHVYVEYVYLR